MKKLKAWYNIHVRGKGWEVIELQFSREVHVLPRSDTRPHHQSDGCWCMPVIEPVESKSNEINWLITHAALDGRK